MTDRSYPSTKTQFNTNLDPIRDAWQTALANSFKSQSALLDFLGFSDAEQKQIACRTNPNLPCRVPLSFAKRMKPRDLSDPLLRQVLLLTPHQFVPHLKFMEDPVGDLCAQQHGFLKKYAGRALMLVKGQCAIHCQYCFRQNFPYQTLETTTSGWEKTIQAIANDGTIQEVILSGGDPLLIRDDRFSMLLDQLEVIPSLKILRIHTRFPVAIPDRITPQFCQRLSVSKLPIVMVIHCNHPNEIDDALRDKLQLLKAHGITVLNQSVLLRGVNDQLQTLIELSYRLFDAGVLPYYLHLLDRVIGAESYWVSDRQARQLIRGLLHSLPGYLVPRCVREMAGIAHKVPLKL